MAKKQTRRSISMQRARHARLLELSKCTGIPAAQIVEQALEAVHDGRIQLEPAISNAERRERGDDGRWRNIDAPVFDHPVRPPLPPLPPLPPPQRPVVTGTCAVCVEDIGNDPDRPGCLVPAGRNGALVKACYACSREPVAMAKHVFRGSAASGMATGCRWTSA